MSYESNEAEGWVIDVLEAAKPTEFQVEKRKNILRPFAPIARHLKDPYVVYLGGLWYMFFSYQTAESDWQNTNNAMADGASTAVALCKWFFAVLGCYSGKEKSLFLL